MTGERLEEIRNMRTDYAAHWIEADLAIDGGESAGADIDWLIARIDELEAERQQEQAEILYKWTQDAQRWLGKCDEQARELEEAHRRIDVIEEARETLGGLLTKSQRELKEARKDLTDALVHPEWSKRKFYQSDPPTGTEEQADPHRDHYNPHEMPDDNGPPDEQPPGTEEQPSRTMSAEEVMPDKQSQPTQYFCKICGEVIPDDVAPVEDDEGRHYHTNCWEQANLSEYDAEAKSDEQSPICAVCSKPIEMPAELWTGHKGETWHIKCRPMVYHTKADDPQPGDGKPAEGYALYWKARCTETEAEAAKQRERADRAESQLEDYKKLLHDENTRRLVVLRQRGEQCKRAVNAEHEAAMRLETCETQNAEILKQRERAEQAEKRDNLSDSLRHQAETALCEYENELKEMRRQYADCQKMLEEA